MKKGGLPIFLFLSLFALGPMIRAGPGPMIEPAKPPFEVQMESARMARKSGEYERAAAQFKEILLRSRQEKNAVIEAACLLDLGITMWDLGEMTEAGNMFAEALPVLERVGDIKNRDICLSCRKIILDYGLGKDFRSNNRFKESVESFDRAIDLGRSLGIADFELKCLRQKSLTYWQLGDFESFHSCNERGLEIARRINHRKEVCRCLNNIGAYYLKTSDYSSGLRICNIALPIIKTINDLYEEAICLNNIAIIYRQLGEIDLAISEMARALDLDVKVGDRLQISKDKVMRGGLFLRRGYVYQNTTDIVIGLNELRESLSLPGLDLFPDFEAVALSNLGYAYLLLKQYDLAIQFFEKAMKPANDAGMREEYGHILNNLGNAHFEKGHISKAMECFSKAFGLFKSTDFVEVIWEASYGLACCTQATGDYKSALTFFVKAIEAIERARKLISTDIFKMGFIHNKMTVYDRAIDILFSFYEAAPTAARRNELFQMAERAKAQAFLESLSANGNQRDNKTDPETRALEQELSRDISALNIKIMSTDPSTARRSEWLRELENREQEYMRIMSDIRTRKRPPTDSQLPPRLTLSEVQATLVNERAAIIEYSIGENRSYAILITRHHSELYSLPGRAELEASLRAYLKFLSTPSGSPIDGNRAAERIASELLVPLQNGNNLGIDTLIIVPDGVLNYLPFETLRVPGADGFSYLLEKYKVSYAPSLSVLQFLRSKQRSSKLTKEFLAFGAPFRPEAGHPWDSGREPGENLLRESFLSRGAALPPLPFSTAEIQKAEKVFPAQERDTYLADQASETVLKQLSLSKYRIMHFACHALLDDDVPLRSALVLSPGQGREDDGFLQVREIYDLRMDAELVVLSACHTGNGSLEKGEGLVGLTRSFFQAGARSVISSLWAINDRSTADFMEDLYLALARGEDKSGALRSAKLKALHSARAHPFYWGAFILSGDPAPVWQDKSGYEKLN